MDKILGMGNALVDVLVRIENDLLLDELHLPKGSMQLIDREAFGRISRLLESVPTHRATGGAAANTISALARLGVKPGFIGKIGADATGAFFENRMRGNGTDTFLLKSTLPSGIASTFISSCGERTFGTYLGAAAELSAADLSHAMFGGYTYLYIEGYLLQDHKLIERAMQLAKEAKMQICLDMASYNVVMAERDFFESLIDRYADIVFANEKEAEAFTGQTDAEEALHHLAAKCSIAVVKTGSKGSILQKGSETVRVKPWPVTQVTDTTGAGDYYAAGFLYGLTCGCSLEKCARISSMLAGYVIQTVGTTLSEDSWNEIKLNIETIMQGTTE